MGAGGCEDGSVLIAEQSGPAGDDGDAACEIEEIGDAVVYSGHAETSLQGMRRAMISTWDNLHGGGSDGASGAIRP